MDQVDAMIEGFHQDFGAFALHLIDFPSQDAAFEFAGSLSFTSGDGVDLSFPEDVSIGLVRSKTVIVLVVAGHLTVDQNYELMLKAKKRKLKAVSQALGKRGLADYSALQAFGTANERLKADHPELYKRWWQFWK